MVKPVELSGMIDYQEGAVVSRTLVKKKGGSITLFAFDEGQGLSEHRAPYDAMVHVIDGVTDVTVAGQETRLKAGEMLLIPANEPHSLHAATQFKMVLTMIKH